MWAPLSRQRRLGGPWHRSRQRCSTRGRPPSGIPPAPSEIHPAHSSVWSGCEWFPRAQTAPASRARAPPPWRCRRWHSGMSGWVVQEGGPDAPSRQGEEGPGGSTPHRSAHGGAPGSIDQIFAQGATSICGATVKADLSACNGTRRHSRISRKPASASWCILRTGPSLTVSQVARTDGAEVGGNRGSGAVGGRDQR